jgi:outer membrane protein, heavy metal efflux system
MATGDNRTEERPWDAAEGLQASPKLRSTEHPVPVLVFAVVASVLGASCVTYSPRPVDPVAQAVELGARNLASPELVAYVAECEGRTPASWPPESWDLSRLTEVALFFSPALAEAQAAVAAAEADLYAVGLHPDPSLSMSFEHRYSGAQGSPDTAGLTFDVPLTTGGKRGIRQAEAAARLRVSECNLQGTAWRVRSSLREALLSWQGAAARVAALEPLAAARADVVRLLEARLEAGESSRPEVEAARSSAAEVAVALAAARQDVAMGRAALARALAVPELALDGIAVEWLADELPPAPTSSEARTQALTGRSDVLAALAAYAASEQALHLEVANQVPDLLIAPGYLYDQGAQAWVIGLSSLVLPLVNRNRGAIAQAEAARVAAGVRVLAVQDGVLHDLEEAEAGYGSALAALASARELEQRRGTELGAIRRGLEAGEEDAVAEALIRAGSEAARADVIAAHTAAHHALGRLEDALECPILPPTPLPPLPVRDEAREEGS